MEKFLYFEHKDKIKKTPPGKKTGELKDKRPKIRGSIFKRQPPLPRRWNYHLTIKK